jgi:hypothetical protein
LAWSPAAQGPEETVPSSPPPFRSQLAFNANIDSIDEAFDVVIAFRICLSATDQGHWFAKLYPKSSAK